MKVAISADVLCRRMYRVPLIIGFVVVEISEVARNSEHVISLNSIVHTAALQRAIFSGRGPVL